MSDTDGFIHEVTEELRRDRMLKIWRTWAPALIGAIVAVVAAAGLLEWHKQQDRTAAQSAGAKLRSAAAVPGPAEKSARFGEAAITLDGGPALVARLSQASAAAEAGDDAAAANALNTAADSAEASGLYRDLAGFRALMIELPDLTPEARIDALTPYLVEGAPFRLLALEQRAVAKLEAGDQSGARIDATDALSDPMASGQLRRRLNFLMELLPKGDDA
jgi:hypothetical protein